MLKILHIATDEKFINAANFIFEKAFNNSNLFIIVQPPSNPALKYIKLENNFEVIVQNASTVNIILKKTAYFEVVVFHGFDAFKAELFLKEPNKQKYIWMLWGAEAYNETVLKSTFLGAQTQVLYNTLSTLTLKQRVIEACKNVYRKIVYQGYASSQNASIKDAIYNMPKMGILYKEEFDFFKQSNVFKPTTTFVPFTYYPIEFIFKNDSIKIQGNDILLGNSASYTNNHIEAIDILSKLNLGNRQVNIPLSYGNTGYANSIIEYAKKALPNNNKPLTGFLPLEEYNVLLSNCGIVIMNHYRQQAVGNVLAALYLGAKVFLNNTTLYQYLKRIGCIIFLIDDYLINQQADTLEILSDEQIEHNRKILRVEIGIDNVVYNLKKSIEENFKNLT